MCDYETVESVNEKLFNNLSELVKMPFFKYFQVRDIFKVDICHVIKNGFRWTCIASVHSGPMTAHVATQDALLHL